MLRRLGKKPAGFSLIELLIVMAIIAILAAIAIPNLLTAQTKAKISKSLAESKLVVTQSQLYNADKNSFPDTIDRLRTTQYISKTVDPFSNNSTNYGYSTPVEMTAGHTWALSVGPPGSAGPAGAPSWAPPITDGTSSTTCAGVVGWSSSYGAITVTGC